LGLCLYRGFSNTSVPGQHRKEGCPDTTCVLLGGEEMTIFMFSFSVHEYFVLANRHRKEINKTTALSVKAPT